MFNSNSPRIQFISLILLFVLTLIASKYDPGGIEDRLLFTLMCIWGPLLSFLAIHYLSSSNNYFNFFFKGAFIGSYLFALIVLSFVAFMIVSEGPPQERGIIFMILPMGQMKAGQIGGAICLVYKFIGDRVTKD